MKGWNCTQVELDVSRVLAGAPLNHDWVVHTGQQDIASAYNIYRDSESRKSKM